MLSGRREHDGRWRLEHLAEQPQPVILQVAASDVSSNGAAAAPTAGSQRWVHSSAWQQSTWFACVRCIADVGVSGCGRDRISLRVLRDPRTECAIFEGNRPFWASIGHTISRALRAQARSAARPHAERAGRFWPYDTFFRHLLGFRVLAPCRFHHPLCVMTPTPRTGGGCFLYAW